MAEPIVNPELPYVGDVPSGLQPGKMLRFQGVTHPNSDRFNINLATGPNAKPRDDTALHLSVRLNQGYIARNTYKDGSWGDEQGSGRLSVGQAQSFEIIILVEPNHYKIAVNGQHFCEFPHRIPYQDVTYLLIDGDVSITLISFEGMAIPGSETSTQTSQVHAEGPQGGQFGGPQYGPPPGSYGAPPPNYGGYAPPPPPGAQPQSEFGGFLEQAQDILAGAIKNGAAEKILGSILHSSGQPQQQPQGYAHQNARYGIYPDLPTQDTAQVPPNLNKGAPNAQDSHLSNLIAGSGGTITTGPTPTMPSEGANPQNSQQKGPFESLLSGLLSGQGGGSAQPANTPGHPQNAQSGGSDVLSGLLSSLLSGNQQTGGQNPPAQAGGANQGSDVLSGILSSLLSNQGQQGSQGTNQPPQVPSQGQNQSQGSDVLSGILSSLLSPNQNQQGPNPPPLNTPQSQSQGGGGDVLSGILQNLIAGNNQPQNAGPGQGPPQGYNPSPSPQNPSQGTGTNSAEMLSNLLQGLLSKAGEQHNNTRPIQETNPSGPPPPQDSQQQYGQYPHAPQQEQRGPMESLLSGLLSGGGQPQQQQQHGPQFGGEGSVGGLGSMGGILGSLAGSLLHRPDQNQGH